MLPNLLYNMLLVDKVNNMSWIEFVFWIVCAIFLLKVGLSFSENPLEFAIIVMIIFILTRPIF